MCLFSLLLKSLVWLDTKTQQHTMFSLIVGDIQKAVMNSKAFWSISEKGKWYHVFLVQCRASVVPLLFISCISAVHLLYPYCSSHVLLFCLSSTSSTSLALFKFLYSSSAFRLRTFRRSQDALYRQTPVSLFFLLVL